MDTVKEHKHSFDHTEWPFEEPTNGLAYTTRRVIKDEYPILFVSHDNDGDWQFLCGTTNDSADGCIICLGCIYQRDKSLSLLADLPIGWQACRDTINHDWERFPRDSGT